MYVFRSYDALRCCSLLLVLQARYKRPLFLLHLIAVCGARVQGPLVLWCSKPYGVHIFSSSVVTLATVLLITSGNLICNFIHAHPNCYLIWIPLWKGMKKKVKLANHTISFSIAFFLWNSGYLVS